MQSNERSSEGYEQLIEGWICEALSRGHTSFAQLVAALPGVYPSVVQNALARLAVDQPQIAALFQRVEQLAAPSDEPNRMIALPIPHPLDYDWRFTDKAVTYLLDICRVLAAPGAQIALLGTPTIFRAALEQSVPYRFTLLENNPAMVAALRHEKQGMAVARCNLIHDPLPQLAARIVIADPPWYEDETHAFLWAARQICADKGYVVVSVPPLGTRPGMAAEWTRTVIWAEQLGLRLLRLEPGVLSYATPLFEHNALLADRVPSALNIWRHGNLALFLVVAPCAAARPVLSVVDDRWDEVTIGGVRIRLRQKQERMFRDPTLQPLINGNVLPSVSRRDPRRAAVDIWTSGNRVFSCQGTPIMRAIACAMAIGQPSRDAVGAVLRRSLQSTELQLVDQATRQLYHVVARERRESAVGMRRVSHDESLYRRSC